MPGAGEPGCTILQYSWEILEKWPDLVYLPSPEPPTNQARVHRQWRREYKHWGSLKCKRQRGAYFCRRHGKWITCEEIEAEWASPQSDEQDRPNQHYCPQAHYDWEKAHNDWKNAEEEIFQKQRDQVMALMTRDTDTNPPATDQTSLTADPASGLESQLGDMYLSNSGGQGEFNATSDIAGPGEYDSTHMGYSYQTTGNTNAAYGSPSTSSTGPQTSSRRDSKASTSKYAPRSHRKGSGSHSSKSSTSKSQASRATSSYQHPAPTSSTYSQTSPPTYGVQSQAAGGYGTNETIYYGNDGSQRIETGGASSHDYHGTYTNRYNEKLPAEGYSMNEIDQYGDYDEQEEDPRTFEGGYR